MIQIPEKWVWNAVIIFSCLRCLSGGHLVWMALAQFFLIGLIVTGFSK